MPKNVKKGKNKTRVVKKIEFTDVADLPEGETYGIIDKEFGNRTFLAKLYNGIEFKCRISAGKRKKRAFLVKNKNSAPIIGNKIREERIGKFII